MSKRVRKPRSIRMNEPEWRELVKAAGHESDRRGGDPLEAGTLGRELILRGARRINARAAVLSSRPDMAAVA